MRGVLGGIGEGGPSSPFFEGSLYQTSVNSDSRGTYLSWKKQKSIIWTQVSFLVFLYKIQTDKLAPFILKVCHISKPIKLAYRIQVLYGVPKIIFYLSSYMIRVILLGMHEKRGLLLDNMMYSQFKLQTVILLREPSKPENCNFRAQEVDDCNLSEFIYLYLTFRQRRKQMKINISSRWTFSR